MQMSTGNVWGKCPRPRRNTSPILYTEYQISERCSYTHLRRRSRPEQILHEDLAVLRTLLRAEDLYTLPRRQGVFIIGQDYSTVDGRSRRKCYWTRASCDCGRLQIGDVTREVEFLSNDCTNPNTNHKTLTMLALTLADHHYAFESFCAPVFCDFVRNYYSTVDGAVLTSLKIKELIDEQ